MRVTRAASRAEHAQHADDANDASLAQTDQDRAPLVELSANTVLDSDITDGPAKKTAVKKGKAKSTANKGAKATNAKATQDEAADDDLVIAQPAPSEAAVDELVEPVVASAYTQLPSSLQ